MPTVLNRQSVGAGATVDVMTDTEYEYPVGQRGNKVTVAAVAEATGVTLSLTLGQRNVMENGSVGIAAASVNPKIPDDVLVAGAALPGERIRVRVTNTTGVAIIAATLVDLS